MSDMYPKYQQFAEQMLRTYHHDHPRVLKTDCYNEARTEFPILPTPDTAPRWLYIDIDNEIISEAKEKYPHLIIRHQDIRCLELENSSVDIIMDFSTIDHIPDYQVALNEYKRVLVKNGRLLVIVWLDDEARHTPSLTDAGQFYFGKKEFISELMERFLVLIKHEYSGVIGGDGTLTRFVCENISQGVSE